MPSEIRVAYILWAALMAAMGGCVKTSSDVSREAMPPHLSPSVPGMAFPLVPAAEWCYEGKICWSEGKSAFSKNVVWMMTVEEMRERQGYSVYVVKGFPADIAWNPNLERKDSVIVRAGDRYYKCGPEAYLCLRRGGDMASLLREDDLFLELPLAAGKTYGGWQVEDVRTVDLAAIRGAPGQQAPCYRLLFRSPSDRLRLDFVPYVGFVAVSYLNHRHPFEAEMKLTAVKIPARQR